MEWLEIIVSILSGLIVCIPLVVKLVNVVKVAVKEKNWAKIVEMTFDYMAEAEKKFQDGATRKEWVMGMVEVAAKQVNYNYDDIARKSISDMIDAACAMAKMVN